MEGIMVQVHTIILWKEADRLGKSFKEIAEEAYGVMNVFQDYPIELRPNYLCASSLKNAKEFEWGYENFEELLKKRVNREGGRIFEDLGYCVGFFSSKKNRESSGFSLNVGTTNKKFNNSCIINLPVSLDLYNEKKAAMICNLFMKLVEKFGPYWGCVVNKVLYYGNGYERYIVDGIPTMVHWLNYWSEDIAVAIGKEKIQQVLSDNPFMKYENGILVAKDTAFDINKEDDMKYHDKIQSQLFL